jgi:hypothetical protein
VPSCQQGAIDSAREQERIAFAAATPRAYAVAPPAAEPYVAPMEPSASAAPAAESYGQAASVTVSTVTNGPVPDTVENRQRYGGPMSNGGRRTQPAGN